VADVDEEQPLGGGRTAVSVVRVGNTIRRTPALNDEFARGLLLHLEHHRFEATPRFLGIDAAGRRIFSELPGDVPIDLGDYGDQTLASAARLIRRYHDATASLFAGPAWRDVGLEVACHNDLSPCNTVFRDGEPYGLIDFDAAAPGTRVWDIGYAAWLWLDLGNEQAYAPEEQIRRLNLFVASYGEPLDTPAVAHAALDRQALLQVEGVRAAKPEMVKWASECQRTTSKLVELLERR